MGKRADQLEKLLQKQKEEKKLSDLETQKRIDSLEAGAKDEKQKRADAERDGALDRALSGIPWESLGSLELARKYYASQVKRDKDTGEFQINGVALDTLIAADIPDKFPNLIAQHKPQSDAQKGTGSKPAKPAPIDFDALSATSTKEELAAASKALAGILAQQN
jgi:hypothetical protein